MPPSSEGEALRLSSGGRVGPRNGTEETEEAVGAPDIAASLSRGPVGPEFASGRLQVNTGPAAGDVSQEVAVGIPGLAASLAGNSVASGSSGGRLPGPDSAAKKESDDESSLWNITRAAVAHLGFGGRRLANAAGTMSSGGPPVEPQVSGPERVEGRADPQGAPEASATGAQELSEQQAVWDSLNVFGIENEAEPEQLPTALCEYKLHAGARCGNQCRCWFRCGTRR